MKKKIRSFVNNTIKESILNMCTTEGTKVFMNHEGNLRSMLVPNALWSSCYIEKELCFIPSARSYFKYEDAGLIKSNLSNDSFSKLVDLYADDEEISIDEANEFWSNSHDYKLLYHYGDGLLEEALGEYIDSYIADLKMTVSNNLTVKIYY
ncbi:MAG: hypothetical protein ACRCX2_33835 [Paraclostridium sp.]